jgi:RecG-like helicase
MRQYGLPYPSFLQSELERYWEKHEPKKERKLFEHLEEQSPMTEEQAMFFNDIKEKLETTRPHDKVSIRLLLASAGCGKTLTARKLLAYARSQGIVAIVVAATGIAALNFPNDGMTAHQWFGVPVVEDFERDLDDNHLICRTKNER